jgi:hypothetical protein
MPALLGGCGGRAAGSGGTWGTAEAVPGLAALNTGGAAAVTSVSCASAGNCAAGGQYRGSSAQQVFVVSQVNGRWGTAEEVPGIAALNTGGMADINSVSCASPGNCAAGGGYEGPGGYYAGPEEVSYQAFVVSQVNGRWGTAQEVPGTAALNTGEQAEIDSVSCTSPGNCAAGGYYTVPLGKPSFSAGGYYAGNSRQQAFVVSQTAGTWGTAVQIPRMSEIDSLSCTSAGNCAAAGADGVVSEKNGTWGTAPAIPGMGDINLVSCATAGNCAAAGEGFVVSEKHGRWSIAEGIPGLTAHAIITSLSCGPAGSCAAGGYISSRHARGGDQGFVVSQDNGTWGTARKLPVASVNSVSCGPAGNCAAGGTDLPMPHTPYSQAFVVIQVKGRWGTAQAIPGLAALDTGRNAAINSVSCDPAGNCSAGGYYADRHAWDTQAFVVSEAS